MSVRIYLGTSSQIWCWSLHATVWGVHLTSIYIHGTRCISRCSGHFMLSRWGGQSDFGIYMCIGLYISIDLPLPWYFLISWPFWMGSHWWHRSVKSSLFSMAVSNGGVNLKIYLGKSENLSSSQDLLLLHRALSFLYRNERPITHKETK